MSDFIQEIIAAIKCSGYRPNYSKIRVARPHRQQRLLGMTINEQPNLPKQSYRKLRALVHRCVVKGYSTTAAELGFASAKALELHLQGALAYAESLTPGRVQKLRTQLESAQLVHTP